MSDVIAVAREIVTKIGHENRWGEVQKLVMDLLAAYATTVKSERMTSARLAYYSITTCYLALNHLLLPNAITFEQMAEVAEDMPALAPHVSAGLQHIKRQVRLFVARLCPTGHDIETFEHGGWFYEKCTRCKSIVSSTEESHSTVRRKPKSKHVSSLTHEMYSRWEASGLRLVTRLVERHPVLQPTIQGAMTLVRRYITTQVSTADVNGRMLEKATRMAVFHVARSMSLPVTTTLLEIRGTEYLEFLSRVGATSVVPSTHQDESIVQRALSVIESQVGTPLDQEAADRVTRFYRNYYRKLVGFAPSMIVAILALIDLSLQGRAVTRLYVAREARVDHASLFNSIRLFMNKASKQVDPALSIEENIRRAFTRGEKEGEST
ncbi:MAG: hypothetical protein GYA24_20905 [Candidatus Lokiarchaeota archaeon]|nr:hypothetical protein [Candidatus Lokiarchaeota archaeon]